jgi:hypothetical protein
VQLVQDACLVPPGGERMLQVRGLFHKSLREVRRWLWLQTGDPRCEDRDAPNGAGRAGVPGRQVRTDA